MGEGREVSVKRLIGKVEVKGDGPPCVRLELHLDSAVAQTTVPKSQKKKRVPYL